MANDKDRTTYVFGHGKVLMLGPDGRVVFEGTSTRLTITIEGDHGRVDRVTCTALGCARDEPQVPR